MSDWDVEVRENRIRELESENAKLKAELQGYQKDLGHLIELRDSGWTIMHPLSCRPNLFDCPYNQAVVGIPDLAERPKGRFWVTMAADGTLLIEE